MKTIKNLLVIMALAATSFAVQAKDVHPASTSKNLLVETMNQYLVNLPYGDLMEKNEQCTLTITFTVNANHEITNIKVTGDNEQMARSAQMKLSNKSIKVDPLIENSSYTMRYRYIVK